MAKRGRPAVFKDPKTKQHDRFKKIDLEWRTNMLQEKDDAKLYSAISTTAMNYVQQKLAKEFDPVIAELKVKMKEANAAYSEGSKMNIAKIEFLIETLSGRGKDVPSIEDFLKEAANNVDDEEQKESEVE